MVLQAPVDRHVMVGEPVYVFAVQVPVHVLPSILGVGGHVHTPLERVVGTAEHTAQQQRRHSDGMTFVGDA